MVILAVDLGKVRTGLAVCDKNEILASPIGTLTEKNEEILLNKIIDKIIEFKAETVVVGLPKNMDGSIGESALRAQKFAETLQEKANVPVNLWDERKTTVTAHEYLNKTNVRGKKRKSIIDTLSASIILENYLEFRKSCIRQN